MTSLLLLRRKRPQHEISSPTQLTYSADDALQYFPADELSASVYPGGLANASDSFRLLKLLPGPRNAKDKHFKQPIPAELTTYGLTEAPSFITLSYSWAVPKKFVDLKLGAQAALLISRYLDDDLRQMRDPCCPVVVWVDSVCINQNDVDERSSQVRIMREIYKSAAWVYVWLGVAASPLEVIGAGDWPTRGPLWVSALERGSMEKMIAIPVTSLSELLEWKERAWWKRK